MFSLLRRTGVGLLHYDLYDEGSFTYASMRMLSRQMLAFTMPHN